MRLLACSLILALTSTTHADDIAAAKARAALALAKTKSPGLVTTAPAPRPAVLDYEAAKKLSIERGVPVVVFVGCDPLKVSDSLIAVVPTMEGYARGTVLICFPSGGHLYADSWMPCPADPDTLIRAVKVAGKKVPPATKGGKLDWS